MDIIYEGERLWVGNLGYFFVALSFVAALFSSIAYFISLRTQNAAWKSAGKWSFFLHSAGVIGIVGTLFIIISNHMYEYEYAWEHSSNTLPFEYILACFWEGQEGSFLLWTFWHVVLGCILIFTSGKWQSSVVITIAMAQVMLSAMLLGLDLWGDTANELGMNPFRLLREGMEAPIFSSANYLSFIEDGQGLNPLLQNYWNVIHPPVLFLGFALTIVPFAYLMAAFYTGEYKEWVKPALPWTSLGVGVLGLGILMGGAWAYEALSFGGFWAWDPVENAVLVPWMVLTGGLHTLVIFKNTQKAFVATAFMLAGGFILILYSTFLTRSGILGDASVHSFTDLGLSGQLLIFLFFFVFLFAGFLVKSLFFSKTKPPTNKTDEEMTSRELWMLVGSLVLVVASFQVIFSTSIPVLNKVFNAFSGILGKEFSMAPPADAVAHYNKFQIPFAVVIALLTAVGQFFKYKKSTNKAYKRILRSFIISLPVTAVMVLASGVTGIIYLILLGASVYAIVANIEMLFPFLKSGKWSFGGASVAHIGLGLLLLGALISNAQKQVVSRNNAGIDLGDDFTMEEKVQNVVLPRGKAIPMSGYMITYHTDSFVAPNHYYKVEYKKIDSETGKVNKRFFLYPNVQINPTMGLVSDPSIRRTFGWDMYTHVTSVPTEEDKKEYSDNENYEVATGDTLKFRDMVLQIGSVNLNPELPADIDEEHLSKLIATSLPIQVIHEGTKYETSPLFIIEGSELHRPAAYIDEIGLRVFFVNINPDPAPGTKNFEIALSVKNDKSPDYIIMKAMVFPMINILWIGCILLFIGSVMAVYRRAKELKPKIKK